MQKVTLIPGDGIGPEVTEAAVKTIEAAGVDIEWDRQKAGIMAEKEQGTPLPREVLDSLRKNSIGLKGPLTTPIGSGFRSVNVALRQKLDLYVNLRPVKTFPGPVGDYEDVDLVVFRENTEGLYAGVEHKVGADAAESIKIITKKASRRIARAAFEYAEKENRDRVSIVHKANIMKLSDGLFLETCQEVADEFPDVGVDDCIVDNLCMQLVQNPEDYDVMVMPNLYGDLVSDLCAGLAGGLGVTPGANLGDEIAVFEAVHGSAPDIAGRGIANPIALMLSGVLMLKHLGEEEAAVRLETAIRELINESEVLTPDLGGEAGTDEIADAVVEKL
ncbi:isocitrate/isopropylmalate dehydrogenase family protein [Halarsenatibacter silvermanii]|uniref:Isocitrate dehydrogenase (NAD+) n=1 Tax=Halarsenatibacter silvermanii TaxID=321763 RepID=A0A1G9J4J7_9FIRM|nr:isocitrate/isopropylmalate dehydrogenase family protein [Halarsenatibacter silvermanii]SDL32261.1 isocitrate dehydrogenase (NAD+) [Halarsenatibacter silvermanii]